MFSSTSYANLFPHLSPPSPFLGNDGTGIFFDHHHHHKPDLLMTDFLPASETIFGMAVSNKAKITNQEANGLNGHHFGPTSVIPKKKDRHSKIYTEQGLRDRRVRLSIEISRKFFDLQDMLGFEKPSKTVDWLLIHSKTAIKDLMNKVKNSSRSGVKSSTLSSISECEVLSGTHDGTDNGVISKRKEIESVSRGKKVKGRDRAAFDHLVSREARARARARARERTREKFMRSDLKTSPNFQLFQNNFRSVEDSWRPAISSTNAANMV